MAKAAPPPNCPGAETAQLEVQVSTDRGETWQSGTTKIVVTKDSNLTLSVRTLLTVTCGRTQGWSFGLRGQENSCFGFNCEGDINFGIASTAGTHTATIQDGAPPDYNHLATYDTDGDSYDDGYTQEVIIDNDNEIDLPPTLNLVTSAACCYIDVPWTSQGIYDADLKFTNDLGSPAVQTRVFQDGQSIVPCVKNFHIELVVDESHIPGADCSLSQTRWITPSDGIEPPLPETGADFYQLEIQVSPDGGQTWYSDNLMIVGRASYSYSVSVRTLLTVAAGQTQGWSFAVRHSQPSCLDCSGAVDLTGVTTAGTHTATVQNSAPPDFNQTAIRGTDGYTQGVVIDNNGEGISLPPTLNFVTSAACYRITMPLGVTTSRVSTARLYFTDDVGSPGVRTVVSQGGQSIVPRVRDFRLELVANIDATNVVGACSFSGTRWITPLDGIDAPHYEPPELPVPVFQVNGVPGGMPACLPDEAFPPVSLGDANYDGTVDITDGVYVLNFLFLGGPQPRRIRPPPFVFPILQTGQATCFDDDSEIACPSSGADFFGQDAQNLDKGMPRSGRLEDFDNADTPALCDGNGDAQIVTDLRTGLMWQRRPETTFFTFDEANDTVVALTIEGVSGWRLPTVGELLSIVDYAQPQGTDVAALPLAFEPEPPAGPGLPPFGVGVWTSTPYALDPMGQVWKFDLIVPETFVDNITDPGVVGQVIAVRDLAPKELPHSGPRAPANPTNAQPTLGDMNANNPNANPELADAIAIFNFLFLNGSVPMIVQRPVIPESIAPGRFVASTVAGNQIETDTLTGLIWTRAFVIRGGTTFLNWETALMGPSPPFAGQSDWRLPNIFELATLIDFTRSIDNPDPFIPPLPSWPSDFDINNMSLQQGAPLWSSTSFIANPNQAAAVIFEEVRQNLLFIPAGKIAMNEFLPTATTVKTDLLQVLAVRGPQ